MLPSPPYFCACLKLLLPLFLGKIFQRLAQASLQVLCLVPVFGLELLYVIVLSFCLRLMDQWTCLQCDIFY